VTAHRERKLGVLLAASLLARAPSTLAQARIANPRTVEVAEDFSDPLTTVPQFLMQDAYTPANYGTAAQANRVIARLIFPRVPGFSLFPFVQLIRPSISLVTVPVGKGRATRTEFGDLQLFDLAVLPWPGRESGFVMDVGPTFVSPSATNKVAGQGRGRSVPPSERSTRAFPVSYWDA
jgi:hypothetical protein